MVVCIDRELSSMEIKMIKVSEKRQITIPKIFYQKLNLGSEVECFFDEHREAILIRPIVREDDFSQFILADLIKQGYNGEALLNEFIRMKKKVRPAIEKMIEEADRAASQLKGTGDDETSEIFADVED